MLESLREFFHEGGTFMYINLAIAALSVAMIVERFFHLYFRYNVDAKAFWTQIEKLIMSNNIDRALKLCNSAAQAAIPRVVKAGLTRANRGSMAIASALDEAILEVTPALQKRVPALWSMANIATLIGLIGTIIGLINAFKAVGLAAPEQKQALLTKGISEAMNNTAFGLSIAVTCIIAHLVLSGVAKRLLGEIEFYSTRLENLLILRGGGSSAASPTSNGPPAA